jgi:hypothetical protein
MAPEVPDGGLIGVPESKRAMVTKNRPKRGPKKRAEATAGPFPLAEEERTYEAQLAGWADREGQFVLIKGGKILGFCPRQEEALEAGYDQLADQPFLVKQILLHEPIYHLGHIEL